MSKSRASVAVVTSLALVCGSALAWADPGNGKGQGNGKGNPPSSQMHGNQGGHGNPGKNPAGGDWSNGPSVNRTSVLGVVGGYRDYWSPGPALPSRDPEEPRTGQAAAARHCQEARWSIAWPPG